MTPERLERVTRLSTQPTIRRTIRRRGIHYWFLQLAMARRGTPPGTAMCLYQTKQD